MFLGFGGLMRDFVTMSYSETLTPSSLVLVLKAMTKYIAGLLSEEFGVHHITSDDIEYLESAPREI